MTRRLHRLLRRLLPPDFRLSYGARMEEVFLEAHRAAARRGPGAVTAVWLREVIDLAVTGWRLRSHARRYGADFVTTGVSRRAAERRGRTMGLVDDLGYAVRSLARRPSTTLFAVLTAALGIGATTAMFGTIESVVLDPLPYEAGDRMVGIWRRVGNGTAFLTPRPEDLRRWSEMKDVFEAVEPWQGRSATLTGVGEPAQIQAALIRPSYHDLIGWSPAVGRSFDSREVDGEGARVLLLSDGFARRAFGSPVASLGGTLRLDGEPWEVVGVMPRGALVPGWGLRAVDVWMPLSSADAEHATLVLALLREGVDVAVANDRLRSRAAASEDPASAGFATLVTNQVSQGIREYLGLLMCAVVLLLLVACVNVSNLLLFRATARRREIAVRAALGGGRSRLTRQLLIESLVLALLGGAAGIGISYAGQAVILELRPDQLEVLDFVSIDGTIFTFAFGVTLAAGLLFGMLPALDAGRARGLDSLRSGLRSDGDVTGRRLRWGLVSAEVALSFALLLGSLSIFSTMVERQRTDMGFRAEDVVVMGVTAPSWRYASSEQRGPLYDAVAERLSALPGVARVARASGAPPRTGVLVGRIEIEGEVASEDTQVLHGPSIREGYFQALGQRVVRGRAFTAEDLAADEGLILVSERTARALFSDRDPIGRRLRADGDEGWRTVVGVVADVPMTGLSATRRVLQVYHPLRTNRSTQTFVVRLAADADRAGLPALMREAAAAVDPELRVDRLGSAPSLMRDTLERERFATAILSVFAALALALAAVGLYGVVSQVVGRRTREIGIRMALGAHGASISSLVLRSVGGATVAGIGGGVALALAGTKVLESQVAGLVSNRPSTFVLAAAVLVLTALLAAYTPTRRAVSVDPVAAMRIE